MKVLAHPDPVALERALVDRVAAVREQPLDRVLVLVPTAVLADHVRRRLAERCDALLGVDVLTLRAFAHRVREGGDAPPLQVLPRILLDTVVEQILDGHPDNMWARHAARRPGSVRVVLHALNDLREAGVTPAELEAVADRRRDRALNEIYAVYVDTLQRSEGRGFADGAALVGGALPHAAMHAQGYRHAFVHGAYELIGVNLELIRAVDEGCCTSVLLPIEPGAPAGAFAERFARRHLLERGGAIERLPDPEVDGGGLLGERLGALHDERAVLPALEDGAVEFSHAQGARNELAIATRGALAAVGRGARPAEVAVIARSLAPYAAALERDAAPLRVTTSLAGPLRRQPLVHDLLVLLRTLLEDFPRGPTVELLASPRLRWNVLAPGFGRPAAAAIDRWSRRAGILGGLDEWSGDLLRWARDDADAGVSGSDEEDDDARARYCEWRAGELDKTAAALRSLDRRFDRGAVASWSAHADRIESLLDDLFAADDGPRVEETLAATRQTLELMRWREDLPDGQRSVTAADVLDWLERAVDESRLPYSSGDTGGVRVLDAMQARGLTFERIQLIGFHGKLFPRIAGPDACLPDRLRDALIERTGRPLPRAGNAVDEERLLLSLLLGSARKSLGVSWQRADEDGRTIAPSLALREVARLVRGEPSIELVTAAATAYPAHPKALLEKIEDRIGLIASEEETLLIALRSPSPRAARDALQRVHPALEPGLAMLRDTERFAPRRLQFDGRVGDAAGVSASLSVSALEQLGRCPLQFFFRRVLGIVRTDDEASPFEIHQLEMGRRVHRVLERLYARLDDEGLVAAYDVDRPDPRIDERLVEAWDAVMADVAPRRSGRLGLLWEIQRESWLAAMREFLDEDLPRVAGAAEGRLTFERELERELSFGGRVPITVRGRLDRVIEGDRPVVSDYKTMGKLDKKVDVTRMLRGLELQAPLYHMLLDGEAEVEMLGVGTYFIAHATRSRRETFAGFDDSKQPQSAGFDETLRVLAKLLRDGRFPLRQNDYRCGFCDYRNACRQNHPPTLEREENAADARDLRLLEKKNKQKLPRLDDVKLVRHQESR